MSAAIAEVTSALDRRCRHCGSSGEAAADAPDGFCCSGCATAYAMLADAGLGGYYRLRGDASAPAAAEIPPPGGYEELDDPEVLTREGRSLPGGLVAIDLHLEGLHCAACVWLLERLPRLVPGVTSLSVDYGRARATLVFAPAVVALSRIARTLASLGYRPHPYRAGQAEAAARREDRILLTRLGVAFASAGNAMVIAFALYGGLAEGMEPGFERFLRLASLVVVTPGVFYGGAVFFRGALAGLRARTLHMDLPIALGILAGYVGGAVNALRDAGDVYFDSVAVLVFLLLAGRLLQRRLERRAAEATTLLYSLHPRRARRIEPERERMVPIARLVAGDRIAVEAGEVLPADGVVTSGQSSLDLSLLTGETMPVAARAGTPVFAGTSNLASRLEITVAAAGETTRLGRILALVDAEARARPPIVLAADRLAGWFVAGVVLLAGAVGIVQATVDATLVLDRVMAMLIVTCPCALGLATPLAVSAALARAARQGLLIRGGEVLQRLATPGTLWLDKTGTLTMGTLALVATAGREWPRLAPMVAALEAESVHPLGVALRRALPGDGLLVTERFEVPGRGVRGRIGATWIEVGSPARLCQDFPCDPGIREAIAEFSRTGCTPVAVAVDGRVVGACALSDQIRPEAPAALAALRAAGWSLGVLSGDHRGSVDHVAQALGIPPERALGEHSPEAKLAVVRATSGNVVMVGDGINDAASLAAASVGIAVKGGAEAAALAAGVTLTRPGLSPLVEVMELAVGTMRVIRRNFGISLGYNVLGAGLAAAGLISPLVAALLMPVSSLTVVLLSWKGATPGHA